MTHRLLALSVLILATHTHGQVPSAVLAIDGQVVNGQPLQNVTAPTISQQGMIAFNSVVGVQIVPFGGGPFTTLANPRVYLNAFTELVKTSQPLLIADDTTLAGGGANGTSTTALQDVYVGLGMYPTRLAVLNGPVPDRPGEFFPGGTGGEGLTRPTMNRGGRVVFGGRSTAGTYGLWWADASAPGGPTPVALVMSGQIAPGVPGDRVISQVASRASVNTGGVVAFSAWYQTPSGSATATFAGAPGSLSAIAQAGDVVGSTTLTWGGTPRLNDQGTIAYAAGCSTGVAVIRQSGATRELVAIGGGTAPGMAADETFLTTNFGGEFGDMYLVGSGDVVFKAGIKKFGVSAVPGMWSFRTPADHSLIYRSGTPLPAVGGLLGSFTNETVANALGHVVFQVSLTGSGATLANNRAILVFHRGLGLRKIVQLGDVITLPGGQSGAVTAISFVSDSGGQDGYPSSLNDQGQFVYRVLLADGRSVILGCVLPTPVTAGAFSLQSPTPGAPAQGLTPTLSWSPSANAVTYRVSITPADLTRNTLAPADGSTITIDTTSTSVSVPPGVLRDCQSVVWSVVGVSTSGGQTNSVPATSAFTTLEAGCRASAVYDIQSIGLFGGVYGGMELTAFAPPGFVGGDSWRYSGTTHVGQDAWLWDGQATTVLSLTGEPYESGGLAVAYRSSMVVQINGSGWAVGTNARYKPGLVAAGFDSWLYNGSILQLIGLVGDGYDQTPGSTTTRRSNSVTAINNLGWAIGATARYTAAGAVVGSDGWLHANGTTQLLVFAGPGYEFASSGSTWRSSGPKAINNAGTIIGTSSRYNTSGGSLGTDSWRWQGGITNLLVITGTEFETPGTGGTRRITTAQFLNEVGHVAGTVGRWNATGVSLGQAAFRWVDGVFEVIDPTDNLHSTAVASGGRSRQAVVKALSPGGRVVGECPRYSPAGDSLGTDVWYFDGVQTRVLGLVGPGFNEPQTASDSEARRVSRFVGMDSLGRVVGVTRRTGAEPGDWGWVFDPAAGATTEIRPSSIVGPIKWITPLAMLESGAVLGEYYYRIGPGTGGCGCGGGASYAFMWTPTLGFQDLEEMVIGGLAGNGWQSLRSAQGGFAEGTGSHPNRVAGLASPIGLGSQMYVLKLATAPQSPILLLPEQGQVVASTHANLTWSQSPLATSYAVSITPAGGPTSVLHTTQTSISVPAGVLQSCQNVTWGVVASNVAGSTPSIPPTREMFLNVADFDQGGSIGVSDIFAFLSAWFASDPRADINGIGGTTVQDIFEFLGAWFAGCP